MAISSSPAGRCGILDSKHWRGRFSTCNLANFLLLLAPKGGRFVSCAAKATAVKVAAAPVSQNLKGYVCLLAIQIVRFRDRSIQTTRSQYCMKNGSLQVKEQIEKLIYYPS
ncbi:homeobox protein Hox-A6 isoform 2-T3 [Chlamydotis macqueenii]